MSQANHTSKGKQQKRSGGVRVLSVVALVVVAAFFAMTVLDLTQRRSAERELLKSASRLYQGMEAYTLRVGHYPSSGDPLDEAFDRESLEPLIREGALRSHDPVTETLAGGSISVY